MRLFRPASPTVIRAKSALQIPIERYTDEIQQALDREKYGRLIEAV